ncbi:hypothetical protein UY3_06010 [Chelonia mydas]|uniref:Myb/SANT-like DNA-binding domain-containing protein n=1 Tax=Chelonia mydas TaxID=8469 RepID=M7BHY4_CHEMY|nr:hypothetical protein UY3_06010 [Chelonia mydas]
MLATRSRCAPAWSTQEVLDLLGLWEEEAVQEQLRSSHRNMDNCEQIAQEKDYNRDQQWCCGKAKELQQAYQKAMEVYGPSGMELQTYHFYKELHTILGRDPTCAGELEQVWCTDSGMWPSTPGSSAATARHPKSA